jgi:hypothetical protein
MLVPGVCEVAGCCGVVVDVGNNGLMTEVVPKEGSLSVVVVVAVFELGKNPCCGCVVGAVGSKPGFFYGWVVGADDG